MLVGIASSFKHKTYFKCVFRTTTLKKSSDLVDEDEDMSIAQLITNRSISKRHPSGRRGRNRRRGDSQSKLLEKKN